MSVSFFTFILPILFHPFHDRKRWREAEKSWSLCSPRARLILLLLMLQPKHHEQQKKIEHTHILSHTFEPKKSKNEKICRGIGCPMLLKEKGKKRIDKP